MGVGSGGQGGKEGGGTAGFSHMIPLMCFSLSTHFVKTFLLSPPSHFFTELVNIKWHG